MEQAVKETVYLVNIPKVEKKVVTVEKQYEKTVNTVVIDSKFDIDKLAYAVAMAET